jgi:hypothetical protein
MRGLSVKRWLYLLHRWLGVALCLLMAAWFLSGVVMMYVGYPKLTPDERLRALPVLQLEGCCVDAQAAMAAAGLGEQTREVKLAMVGRSPAWLVSGPRAAVTVDAASGKRAGPYGAAQALRAADQFLPGHRPELLEVIGEDIFTASRGLDMFRPLLRVALNDPAGTEVYVSQKTGEVVRDSTRAERNWNYVGAITHYIYPLRGGVFDKWWSDIIIYLSLAATIATVIGIYLGVIRWRFSGRYKSGSRTPYRSFMLKWHHIIGLLFGAVTLTWIFSGLMSMNPWKIFERHGQKTDLAAYQGGALHAARPRLAVADALTAARAAGFEARELSLAVFDGAPWYLLRNGAGSTRLLRADAPRAGELLAQLPRAALLRAAPRLLAGRTAVIEELRAYDFYYYQRDAHAMLGHLEHPLPALRVKFDDPDATWFHLDAATGAIVTRADAGRRQSRLWFALLHSWDFPGFVDQRPWWDLTLIALSIGGFLLCITSVVIGWRRLLVKLRPHGGPVATRPVSPHAPDAALGAGDALKARDATGTSPRRPASAP